MDKVDDFGTLCLVLGISRNSVGTSCISQIYTLTTYKQIRFIETFYLLLLSRLLPFDFSHYNKSDSYYK